MRVSPTSSTRIQAGRLNNELAMIFLGASVYQMTVWALKKHRIYKKEFGKEYPRGRKAMFPFIL